MAKNEKQCGENRVSYLLSSCFWHLFFCHGATMKWYGSLVVLFASIASAQEGTPKAADPRLVVELVARDPDIVHPVSCDFDHKGRLLVIESHTHFAPKGYTGPKHDRIRAFDV